MVDLLIRKQGRAGRITLNRPDALNALTPQMCHDIHACLTDFAKDASIDILIIDGAGEKAFCAGGDIAQVYAEGRKGNAAYAQDFWRAEYHMNAALFHFPKPVISFLQGFTMGGGVGVGCHASHRIVTSNSRIALPECSIGLVTDVGGSLLLARAPGRLGEYLACTSFRMGPEDAIYAGFADYKIDQNLWPQLIKTLCETGNTTFIDKAAEPVRDSDLKALQHDIDLHFCGETLRDIVNALEYSQTAELCIPTLKYMAKNDPLAMGASVELVHRARRSDRIESALEQEFRFTHRAVEQSDFLEGIRACIIEKDRKANWTNRLENAPIARVTKLLLPLGAQALWV